MSGSPLSSVRFQSTPLIRGETIQSESNANQLQISIHSPHTRGDPRQCRLHHNPRYFNPLPSYEGRPEGAAASVGDALFQSTPLIRGETGAAWSKPGWRKNFNPLPSYEGRPNPASSDYPSSNFNPLPSYEGRLDGNKIQWFWARISIHSPHTRGDLGILKYKRYTCNFNPLPSYEGRLAWWVLLTLGILFQSTPLIRGETSG